MLVPTGMHDLYTPRAPLDQPSRHEAVMGEGAAFQHLRPIEVQYMLGALLTDPRVPA